MSISFTGTPLEEKSVSIENQDVATEKAEVKGAVLIDAAEEKALVRKIDLHLLPLMLVSYMLQFLDKTALGYTALFGIQSGTGLVGDQYSWASSAFYLGYLFASYPTSLGFVKFPLGKFLAITFTIWAVILACHGAVSSFAGLMALRLLLGIMESTISPGMTLMTGIWYKRSEHASRHGIWFAGNSLSSIFGGLFSYGIGHISNSVAPWRWIFIIFGIITFCWGIVLIVFLPDSPLTARFLTPSEREVANLRPQQETHSFKSYEWSRKQFIEALKDPKSWLLFFYTIATSIPNGGLTSFSGLIIQGFGFSTFDTLLVGMPGSAFGLLWVLLSTFLASKIRKSRCAIMGCLLLISLTGALMVSQIPSSQRWARLAGIWLFSAYAAGLPLSLSLISSDVAGYTKKATVSAMLFVGYCTGNVIGPFLFFTNEAPKYQSAWIGIMISLGAGIVCITTLRQLMAFENHRRDRKQGVKIDPETQGGELSGEAVLSQSDNETDWEMESFRYYL